MHAGLLSFLSHAWRIVFHIGRTVWEMICWLIVPAVFGFLCYTSIIKKFEISVLQIVLAAIALSPWILRLLSRYLSEFDIGLKGISGKTREAVKNRAEIDDKTPIYLANEKIPEVVETAFGEFLPQAKKVLRTLWKYQVEHFGPDDIRRWGFVVGKSATDSPEFMLGITQPLMHHFAYLDARGFVFLTDAGVAFCKQHNEEIASYPFYYSHFSN